MATGISGSISEFLNSFLVILTINGIVTIVIPFTGSEESNTLTPVTDDMVSASSDNDIGYTLSVNKCTAVSQEKVSEALERAIAWVTISGALIMRGGSLSLEEESRLDPPAIQKYFDICSAEFVRGNAEERARIDAKDFVFPENDLLHDGESLRRLGSIEAVVKERHLSSRAHRFNPDRYNILAGTTDAPVLCGLATFGAAIPVASDFVCNPLPERPRKLQQKLGNCYCKHAHKLWKSGGALIFREQDVPASERCKLNLNPLHWCSKPFCDCGRWLGDLSNRENGTSINCPESKDLAKSLYGELSYPSIEEIVTSWLTYAASNQYALKDLRIWKEDIRSAFGQFNILPSDTYKLAFSFAEGLILIMIWGFFGWTGAPMVFANFSRAMLETLAKVILGVVFLFCDDFIGCGHHSIAARDQSLARELIVSVFGEGKVALEKSVPPTTQTEVLGWWIDLETETIRPSDKGIRKLMFVFFSINTSASHWTLQMCQVLASLAQRYSQALMGMRPFVHAFHEMCGGPVTATSQFRRVTPRARFAVEMWRSCLILLFINKDSMSVSLKVLIASNLSFTPFALLTDASYLGSGHLVLNEDRILNSCPFSRYLFKFLQNRRLADLPKYQNHREFGGLLVGLIMMIKMNIIPSNGGVIHWVNDNKTALSWARKNMCKGKNTQVTFMFYSALLIKYKLHIVQVEHTAGLSDLMKPVDALSRGLPTPELSTLLEVNLNDLEALDDLMALCNPTLSNTTADYHTVYESIHDLLLRLIDENRRQLLERDAQAKHEAGRLAYFKRAGRVQINPLTGSRPSRLVQLVTDAEKRRQGVSESIIRAENLQASAKRRRENPANAPLALIRKPTGRSETPKLVWNRLQQNWRFIVQFSVKETSLNTYSTALRSWKLFCHTAGIKDIWLNSEESEFTAESSDGSVNPFCYQVTVLLSFIAFLHGEQGVAHSTVGNYLSGVRHWFKQMFSPYDWCFDEPIISQARSSLHYLSVTNKELAADKKTLPFTCDMVVHAGNVFLKRFPNSMQNSGIYVALVIAFCCLMRSCEIFITAANHYLRGQDVVYGVLVDGFEKKIFPRDAWQYDLIACRNVTITVHSAKNDWKGEGHRMFFSANDPDIETQGFDLVSIMFAWSKEARTRNDDAFLAYNGGKNIISYDQVSAVIKKVAIIFGFDPIHFHMHSLRIGGASTLAMAGKPSHYIQKMGRWKSLAFLQYIHWAVSGMADALRSLSNPTVFTAEHLKRINPAAMLQV